MIPVCPGCGEKEAPELSNIMHGRPWWLTRQMHDEMECGPQPGDLVDDTEQEGALYQCEACGARWEFAGPCPEKCPTCGGNLGLVVAWGSVGPSADPEQDAGNEPIPF